MDTFPSDAKTIEEKVIDSKSLAQMSLSAEDMVYRLTPDISLVSARRQIRNYPQTNVFSPSQRMTLVFNSGADYILPKNCYLTFEVKVSTGTGTINSAIDFIQSIAIFSRTNDELERINNVNLLANVYNRVKYSKDWFHSVGSLAGYKQDLTSSANTTVTTTPTSFVIPLSTFSGLFNYGKLLPNHLVSGMRIEITWETNDNALYGATAPTVYEISNPSIVTDNYKLNDLAYKLLNLESAENGLEVEYTTFFNQQSNTPGASINVECRKAVSRALLGLATTRRYDVNTALSNNTLVTENVIDPSESGYKELQWRCGSLFYPNQKLTQLPEMFCLTLSSMGKLTGWFAPPGISFDEWTTQKGALLAVDLERSTKTHLSAIPLNNSRVLSFNLLLTKAQPDRLTDVFLKYVKVARCFLNNTTIEE